MNHQHRGGGGGGVNLTRYSSLSSYHQQQQHSDMVEPMTVTSAAHDSVYALVINAFHSLPHLNMWFELSNSTFDPNNSEYLEV
jgi:hypothetical protein